MTFWTSYDTEAECDHLFVEARTPGGDDWATLPDANGHTTTATGQSCPAGWVTLHPHLAHYQTFDGVGACTATGTTGAWNAASGNSASWQQWSVDLSAYAGESVEISIAYASDWAVQGIGVFVDDVVLPTARARRSRQAWTVAPSPGRPRAAHRTSTTSSEPTHRASRSATRSPRRTRCCWGSDWRASRLRPNATQ